jgi:hypothetical protein
LAAERAFALVIERFGAEERWPQNMYSGESLAHLLKMHKSIEAGEPPNALNDLDQTVEFTGELEDLQDLWGSADD